MRRVKETRKNDKNNADHLRRLKTLNCLGLLLKRNKIK